MRFLLELNHRIQPVLRPNATEDPGQLAVERHLRLHKHAHLRRVDPCCHQNLSHLERIPANALVVADLGVIVAEGSGERVVVSDHEVALGIGRVCLVLEHVGDGSQVVADVQLSCGLYSCEEAFGEVLLGVIVAANKGLHYSLISYYLWRVIRTGYPRQRWVSISPKMTWKTSVLLFLADLLSNLSKSLIEDLERWAKERSFRFALMNEIKAWVD